MKRIARLLTAAVAGLLPFAAGFAVAQQAPPELVLGTRTFSPATYHADPQNWAVIADNRGILYFGNHAGVLEFDGTRWHLIALPGNVGATALGKSTDGRILVGGEGEMGWLAPDAAGSMVYVSKSADLPYGFRAARDRVIRILDTPLGQVFLADHWLFVRASNGHLTSLPAEDHYLQAAWYHNALYVVDSTHGLTRYEDGTLKDIPGGGNLRGLTMLVTSAGMVIPSFNDGLIRYNPEAANPFTILNATEWTPTDSEDVTCGVALGADLLALGTGKHGVTLINAEGKVVKRIGTEHDSTTASIYGIAYDHSGGLWLALDEGLSLVDLNLPKQSTAVPFQAWIRSVVDTQDEHPIFGGTYFSTAGGIQQLLQGNPQILTFPHNQNAFRFDYSANGLLATGDMQFQTYMQGVDKGWSSWSTRSEREFTQLGAGSWNFQVRGRKANGEISDVGSYEFHISPAWYDTWWFTVFQVFFVLGLLLLPGHTHQHEGFQRALTKLAVIFPFVYIGDWLTDLIGHYYSTDVGFVKIMMSALLAFMLDPMQGLVEKQLHKRNERRRAKVEAKRAAKLAAQQKAQERAEQKQHDKEQREQERRERGH